jgi:hypothetical protein
MANLVMGLVVGTPPRAKSFDAILFPSRYDMGEVHMPHTYLREFLNSVVFFAHAAKLQF